VRGGGGARPASAGVPARWPRAVGPRVAWPQPLFGRVPPAGRLGVQSCCRAWTCWGGRASWWGVLASACGVVRVVGADRVWSRWRWTSRRLWGDLDAAVVWCVGECEALQRHGRVLAAGCGSLGIRLGLWVRPRVSRRDLGRPVTRGELHARRERACKAEAWRAGSESRRQCLANDWPNGRGAPMSPRVAVSRRARER